MIKMIKLYKCYKWKNDFVIEDKPIMKEYVFLNFFSVSRHFKGFQDGGFRIEIITSKSWFSWSFKGGFQSMKDVFKEKDFKIVLRFAKPILTFGLFNPKREFKNVTLLN
jgi:hypothetical protein